MARDLPGREPRHVVPLGARRRGRRLRVGERHRASSTTTSRTPTTSCSRSAPKGRPGTCARSSTRSFPTASPPSGSNGSRPEWAVPRSWDELPTGRGPDTPREFGGDLAGIEARLDHIEQLGANVLYLTPFFPATSTHRYDATSFDHVDPLLGGDEALASLTDAAHRRGHAGDRRPDAQPCRRRARLVHAPPGRPRRAPERGFFCFDDALPRRVRGVARDSHAAEARLPFAGAPRRRMAAVSSGAGSSRPSSSTAGASTSPTWSAATVSVDVGDVARAVRAALAPDPTRCSSPSTGTTTATTSRRRLARGDELRGVPATGLGLAARRPGSRRARARVLGHPGRRAAPRRHGVRRHDARVPRRPAVGGVLHSWTLLDSHDTARFRTVAGSRERHVVGIGLQMTTPGVPMVFARATRSGSRATGARTLVGRCRGSTRRPGTPSCSRGTDG